VQESARTFSTRGHSDGAAQAMAHRLAKVLDTATVLHAQKDSHFSIGCRDKHD